MVTLLKTNERNYNFFFKKELLLENICTLGALW